MKKLKSRKGESLIELLASVVIIALGALIMAGAIITTARVNDKAQSDTIVNFENELDASSDVHENGTVEITFGTRTSKENVTIYTQKNSAGGSDESVLYYYR